ncbi:hypothetical protein OAG51_01520 [Pirellulaceae bacterium]|jgi:hypothetical protein|nr:hypothetical protein [Pirellulaceae bacterium]
MSLRVDLVIIWSLFINAGKISSKTANRNTLTLKLARYQANSAGTNRKQNSKVQPGNCYNIDSYRNAILRGAKSATKEKQ